MEDRLRRLERAWARQRPAVEFYELMVTKGLRESLPKMLEDYQDAQAVREYVTGRRKVWRSKWAWVLAIFGALIPFLGFIVAIYNAVHLTVGGH